MHDVWSHNTAAFPAGTCAGRWGGVHSGVSGVKRADCREHGVPLTAWTFTPCSNKLECLKKTDVRLLKLIFINSNLF